MLFFSAIRSIELNTSIDKGAAVYIEGDIPLSIENSVFVHNSSYKGTIFVENSDKISIVH